MKKIFHLITSLEGGGTENFLYQILANSPAGYDHQVLYLKKNGVIGDRIRQLSIPVRAIHPLELYGVLKQEKPDLLHSCLYSAHQLARVLGRLARVPVIITSQRSIDVWQKPWQTVVDRWTLPGCDAVIANSHAAVEIITARRGDRKRPEIIRIPNGIDAAEFKPAHRDTTRQRYGLKPDALVGGALMRLHREKGADLIPDFAARVLPLFPKLHLLIGGVGPLDSVIKERLARTPHRDRVHWAGWVEDIPSFLAACDFFWSLSREESFPQSLLEAAGMGLPWIAPQTGGVPDLQADGAEGQVFPRLDLAAAAGLTSNVIKDHQALSMKARQAAPKIQDIYSLTRMVRRVYDVFERFSPFP